MKRRALLVAATVSGALCLAAHPHMHQSKDRHRVVFDEFPSDAQLFRQDLRPVMDQIIEKHGEEEWETIVLTSELHTHLGIYSVVGAKMGLRAREYFGVGLDRLAVTSFAGRQPPISCLNDGIQVSTGATLGHGTIVVAEKTPGTPKAHFSSGEAKICLELKEPLRRRVRSDIGRIIERHGAQTEAYWVAVRRLGIQYWLDWSRDDIFDLTVLSSDH